MLVVVNMGPLGGSRREVCGLLGVTVKTAPSPTRKRIVYDRRKQATLKYHHKYDMIITEDRSAFLGTSLNASMATTMNEHVNREGAHLDFDLMGVLGQLKPG